MTTTAEPTTTCPEWCTGEHSAMSDGDTAVQHRSKSLQWTDVTGWVQLEQYGDDQIEVGIDHWNGTIDVPVTPADLRRLAACLIELAGTLESGR